MGKIEEKEAVDWLKSKLTPKQPPRGQATGPFQKSSRAYVPCPLCTRMVASGNPKYTGTVGTAKQTQKQHMQDHKAGRIRKPVLVPA